MMKIKMVYLISALLVIALSACQPNGTSAGSQQDFPPVDDPETLEYSVPYEEIANYNSQTACDHPYFPMRIGSVWKYVDDDGNTLTWNVIEVTGDLASAFAVVEVTSVVEEQTSSSTAKWNCDADGIFAAEWEPIPTVASDDIMYVYTYRWDGILLPPPEHMFVGCNWSNDYENTYDILVDNVMYPSQMCINHAEEFTVQGIDKIIVPAGEFDAVNVAAYITQKDATLNIGRQVLFEICQESENVWLAKGVGLVRLSGQRVTDGSASISDIDISLVEYSIP
jgi:hypothetical protein